MREHKYRAWDREKRQFYHEPIGMFNSLPSNWESFYDIQQYTGLKDKNGVEIYEGDILRKWNQKFPFEPVEYYAENSIVEYHEVSGQYAAGTWKLEQDNIDRFNWEVIGNIYENGELLDG
ncbi:hypothetical protein LCGC14_0527720 [marine sediment metagenome]|uniref:YopX protein domain-containing protein n=1 Tax=marine sediment metagenome TaxID=412755 RepID=A0A0F9UI40_9ZZZZ